MEPGRPEDRAQPPTDPSLQPQLDLFRKLGFPESRVRAVLLKLGLHCDTDRVLAELIQTGVGVAERADGSLGPQDPPRQDGSTSRAHVVATFATEQKEMPAGEDALRPVVIDGSNVAMSHGNKEVFSCLGIQLAVEYFLSRGHTDITVFVPLWRREQPRPDVPITDQQILRELEKKRILVFTPSRRVAGKRVVCYDDRFIVRLAYESDGVIVSNDTYRDLQGENPEWKCFIEERLLMYSFVNDKFMPPDDPLGRHGPSLENFLRKTPRAPKKVPCPYGKKCTYGIKCKFSHPERPKQSHRSVADELRDKAKMPSSAHGPPDPVGAASLGDVMERKLSLERSASLKKPSTSKNVLLIKTASPSRKSVPKPGRYPSDAPSAYSQEYPDSGLGSYESHCERQRGEHGTSDGGVGYGPSRRRHSPHAVHYPPSQHHSYGGYPAASFPTCNHSASMLPPHVHRWSETYRGYSSCPPCPGDRDPAPGIPPPSDREQVRKKLRAVFNTQLVERAMNMFPNIMDPQKLAAEILNLQSYEGVL